MMEKLLEVKRLINDCKYELADYLLNSVYETYTSGDVYFTEDEENFMFALLSVLSRKMYG